MKDAPFVSNIERIILGTILYHGQMYDLRKELNPFDFADFNHRAIFEAMCDLEDLNEKITCDTVRAKLMDKFGSSVGQHYLNRLLKHKLKKNYLLRHSKKITNKFYHHKKLFIKPRYDQT